MNKFLLLSFSIFFKAFVHAQITVSSAFLPVAGDVYNYSVDTSVSNIINGNGGANQVWDFKSLKAQRNTKESYVSASTVNGFSSFPTSNLAMVNTANTNFYRATNKNLEFLGFYSSGNPLFGGANIFEKPAVILRTPIDYNDQYDYSTNFQVAIPGNFIPDSLTMGISVDSIRIKLIQNTKVTVDAWGKLSLSTKTFDVLRLKMVNSNSLSVEAKLPFIGWFDITQVAGAVLGNLLGATNSTVYNYVSNDTKGHVASVSVDSSGNVTNVSFKNLNVGTNNPTINKNAFELVNNFSTGEISIINKGVPSGNYRICLTTLDGLEISNSEKWLNQNELTQIISQQLVPGNYYLSIYNKESKPIWFGDFLQH